MRIQSKFELFGSRLPVYNRARNKVQSREQQGRQSVTRQRSAIRLSDSRPPCPFAMGLAIPYDDYVSKAKPWYEVLRKVAFSPFGLFVLMHQAVWRRGPPSSKCVGEGRKDSARTPILGICCSERKRGNGLGF